VVEGIEHDRERDSITEKGNVMHRSPRAEILNRDVRQTLPSPLQLGGE
jgi:hypothetical protein